MFPRHQEKGLTSNIMELKHERKERVILSAIEIFKETGIENSKLSAIAERAQVGIASLYRYFKTKPELVIAAATKLWQQEAATLQADFNTDNYENLSGIGQINMLLNIFIKLYEEHQDFLRFLDEFDSYVLKEKLSEETLTDYEENIISLKSIFSKAILKGINDKTIRADFDLDTFYFTTTHSLMSLCQKLVLKGSILKSDKFIEEKEQLKLLIKMSIKFIENK
jgi:AcrR family transcriptional regulator